MMSETLSHQAFHAIALRGVANVFLRHHDAESGYRGLPGVCEEQEAAAAYAINRIRKNRPVVFRLV